MVFSIVGIGRIALGAPDEPPFREPTLIHASSFVLTKSIRLNWRTISCILAAVCIARTMALFAQSPDARQRGHNVRHQNRQRHFKQPGVRHLAFEKGIPVVDQDENNTHDDRVFERAFDDGGL